MPSPSLVGFSQKAVVGIADLIVSNSLNLTLATYSLGSCIGVTIYDPALKVGGLLHYMLPDSTIDPKKAAAQPAMFADSGVPALFRAAYGLGANKHRMQICVAGGAQMMDESGFFNIGKRNHQTLATLLDQHGLRVQATQVGGLVSRTMFLELATGTVRLKVSGQTQEITLFKP